MESTQVILLTPYNYFDWKPRILHQLRNQGLYRLTMATEAEPTSTIEKSKYFNHMDEAHSLLCMSVSLDLWFHIDACTTLNGIWTTLVNLFGNHMLEVELNYLDPKSFDNIQDFFTKFKSILLNLKGCGVDKSTQENKLVLSILEKLGPNMLCLSLLSI
jgi:hypothetical protein